MRKIIFSIVVFLIVQSLSANQLSSVPDRFIWFNSGNDDFEIIDRSDFSSPFLIGPDITRVGKYDSWVFGVQQAVKARDWPTKGGYFILDTKNGKTTTGLTKLGLKKEFVRKYGYMPTIEYFLASNVGTSLSLQGFQSITLSTNSTAPLSTTSEFPNQSSGGEPSSNMSKSQRKDSQMIIFAGAMVIWILMGLLCENTLRRRPRWSIRSVDESKNDGPPDSIVGVPKSFIVAWFLLCVLMVFGTVRPGLNGGFIWTWIHFSSWNIALLVNWLILVLLIILRNSKRIFYGVFWIILLPWVVLFLQTCRRIFFVIENRGMDSMDLQGSPMAFLIGFILEQILFIPLTILILVGFLNVKNSTTKPK